MGIMDIDVSDDPNIRYEDDAHTNSSEIHHSHEGGTTSQNPETEEYQPETKYVQCYLCYGSGRCGVCGGGGWLYRSSGPIDCSNCDGSGRCPACNGSGVTEYVGW